MITWLPKCHCQSGSASQLDGAQHRSAPILRRSHTRSCSARSQQEKESNACATEASALRTAAVCRHNNRANSSTRGRRHLPQIKVDGLDNDSPLRLMLHGTDGPKGRLDFGRNAHAQLRVLVQLLSRSRATRWPAHPCGPSRPHGPHR